MSHFSELNDLPEMPEPTWRMLLGRGLPNFALEGVLPVLLFYGVWREAGLGPAVVASTAAAGTIVVWQARRGMDVALAAVTCVFIVIQALVGLAAHSATVYLAQPVVLSGLWGVAYVVSAAIGKPLIGAFARAWYPFPAEFRASKVYRHEFTMQSVVWGVYCLARCGLRLWVLLSAGVGGLVLVSTATGAPILAGLAFWGIWHARRVFGAAVAAASQRVRPA
jgi:intracellular septation protein A